MLTGIYMPFDRIVILYFEIFSFYHFLFYYNIFYCTFLFMCFRTLYDNFLLIWEMIILLVSVFLVCCFAFVLFPCYVGFLFSFVSFIYSSLLAPYHWPCSVDYFSGNYVDSCSYVFTGELIITKTLLLWLLLMQLSYFRFVVLFLLHIK